MVMCFSPQFNAFTFKGVKKRAVSWPPLSNLSVKLFTTPNTGLEKSSFHGTWNAHLILLCTTETLGELEEPKQVKLWDTVGCLKDFLRGFNE